MPNADDLLEITIDGKRLPEEMHTRVCEGLKSMLRRELEATTETRGEFSPALHTAVHGAGSWEL